MRAQEDYQAADEATGGTQSALLELKKREKAKERERLKEKLIAPTVAKEAEADPTIEASSGIKQGFGTKPGHVFIVVAKEERKRVWWHLNYKRRLSLDI